MLDELILMEIYPAREEPIAGVSSGMLSGEDKDEGEGTDLQGASPESGQGAKPEVLVSMGAGDINQFRGPLTEWLLRR